MLYYLGEKKPLSYPLAVPRESLSLTQTGTEVSRKEHQCRLSKCLELFSGRGTGLMGAAGSLGGKTNFLVLKSLVLAFAFSETVSLLTELCLGQSTQMHC